MKECFGSTFEEELRVNLSEIFSKIERSRNLYLENLDGR